MYFLNRYTITITRDGRDYENRLEAATLQPTAENEQRTFSVVSGRLPPGVTLNALTGAITGTAQAEGAFKFLAVAVDSRNNNEVARRVARLSFVENVVPELPAWAHRLGGRSWVTAALRTIWHLWDVLREKLQRKSEGSQLIKDLNKRLKIDEGTGSAGAAKCKQSVQVMASAAGGDNAGQVAGDPIADGLNWLQVHVRERAEVWGRTTWFLFPCQFAIFFVGITVLVSGMACQILHQPSQPEKVSLQAMMDRLNMIDQQLANLSPMKAQMDTLAKSYAGIFERTKRNEDALLSLRIRNRQVGNKKK